MRRSRQPNSATVLPAMRRSRQPRKNAHREGERVSTSILLFPPALPALRNEHLARNDCPRLGKFSRAAERVAELTVLHSAHDGELVGPAGRHSGREARPARLSVGDTNAPGQTSAVAPRGLAGSNDSIPIGHRSRLRLSVHDDQVCLSARAAIYGDLACADPVCPVARTIQSTRSAVLARRSVAAGVRKTKKKNESEETRR